MKPSFYTFANFFLGLALACGLVQSCLQFLIGRSLYFLQTFAHWYLTVNFIAIISTVFVLCYLWIKKYRSAFWTGTVATALLVCQSILTYIILIKVLREWQNLSLLLLIPFLIASVAFATRLVFSEAAERTWLKVAGVLMLICYTFFGSAFAWGLFTPNFFNSDTFLEIERWTSLAGNLVTVFFIMNFRSELHSPAASVSEGHVSTTPSHETALGVTGMVALVVALILGWQVSRESFWNAAWQKKGPEKNRELATRFETRYHVDETGDTLRYLFKAPHEYDPQKEYPLVVCLHGGPVRSRNVEVAEPAPYLTENGKERRYPAFILVPQAPPGHTWGGLAGFPSVDSAVFETIAALEQEYSIDKKRRYVVGGSMGGYGAWHFIATRPEMFAAAIPFCGGGDPALANKMAHVPVWAFHGDVDRNVSVEKSRVIIEAIKKAGGNPRYTEFSGVGHNVWPEIVKTDGVMEWMFEQRR